MKKGLSLWTATAMMPSFPILEGDHETDVLIIGGGLTGVLCAHFLAQAGVPCLLVEANSIGGGVSGHTTAKLTLQHGLLYDGLIRGASEEGALQYLHAQQAALSQYRDICQSMDCDYSEKPAFVYSQNDRQALELEAKALQRLGVQADVVDGIPLPLSVVGAVRVPDQAQFHPLKFLAALCAPLRIFEHTRVLSVRGCTANTYRGRIVAKKILFACHFPFVDRHGLYAAKMYQHRSYVLALENAPQIEGMYVGQQDDSLSFRNAGSYLFIGGGDHRTGKPGGGYAAIEAFAAAHYPNAPIRYAWAAQDCMTLDSVPYIGGYARLAPDWYVATGFNKWGMTAAMAAALLLRDVLTGVSHPFAPVFDPRRSMLKPQLLANAGETLMHLLTPSTKRCTHLCCALQWNDEESSWDCPCHGSRFDPHGQVLDSPAIRRARVEK